MLEVDTEITSADLRRARTTKKSSQGQPLVPRPPGDSVPESPHSKVIKKVDAILDKRDRLQPAKTPANDFIPPHPPQIVRLDRRRHMKKDYVKGAATEAIARAWFQFYVSAMTVLVCKRLKRSLGRKTFWEQARDRIAREEAVNGLAEKQIGFEPDVTLLGPEKVRAACRRCRVEVTQDLQSAVRAATSRKQKSKLGKKHELTPEPDSNFRSSDAMSSGNKSPDKGGLSAEQQATARWKVGYEAAYSSQKRFSLSGGNGDRIFALTEPTAPLRVETNPSDEAGSTSPADDLSPQHSSVLNSIVNRWGALKVYGGML